MDRNSHNKPGPGPSAAFFAPALKRYETCEYRQTGRGCFAAVSTTGSVCELMCDHCHGAVLKGMRPALSPDALIEEARRLRERGGGGLLVSGGSDREGVVPLAGFLDAIRRVREELGMKVIVHTGITDAALATGLAAAGVDAALIDVIGDAQTIHDVCHLRREPADYERSLENLTGAGVPVAPHVVIGLHRGRLAGERRALEMIARYPVSSVVLVGIRPLPGTPLSGVKPPAPREFGEIFRVARELFPVTPVVLGCERPPGRHKERTDRLALEAGLDGIAFPAEETPAYARALDREPFFSESCCALLGASRRML